MKKNQKIKPQKSFHPQARLPGPRFAAGLCPLLFSVVLMFTLILICDEIRQTNSFGRNQAKLWWVVRLQGHTTFAKRWLGESGQFLRPQVLPDLQRKGLVRQRSLLADLIFGYFLSRESNSLSRGE
jgi:hypothetical protein